MNLTPHHEDGLSNIEVAWLVYCAFVLGLLVVLFVLPAVIA